MHAMAAASRTSLLGRISGLVRWLVFRLFFGARRAALGLLLRLDGDLGFEGAIALRRDVRERHARQHEEPGRDGSRAGQKISRSASTEHLSGSAASERGSHAP